MSKGSGLAGKIAAALRGVGLKAPWQVRRPDRAVAAPADSKTHPMHTLSRSPDHGTLLVPRVHEPPAQGGGLSNRRPHVSSAAVAVPLHTPLTPCPPLPPTCSSQGRVSIPHSEPERVYDIKYYRELALFRRSSCGLFLTPPHALPAAHDSRRAHLPGGTTMMVKEAVDPRAGVEAPATPGKQVTWKGEYKNILDNDHNGYTM